VIERSPYWPAPKTIVEQRDNDLPKTADVVIVGAGLTGLSAARTLALAGRAVVVCEADAIGHGASGRNGGMVGGGHRLSLQKMTDKYGRRTAEQLLREAHIDSNDFTQSLMRDANIDCDYEHCGRFRAFYKPSEYEAQAQDLTILQKAIGLDAHMVPENETQNEIQSELYRGGIVFESHGGLNPVKWTHGIAKSAIEAGALIHHQCAVTNIASTNVGSKISTQQGTIVAGQVLMATNGYTTHALRTWRHRILPIPSFIVATEPLGKNRVRSLFPNGRMMTETRARHCYFRPSPDGERVLFGGRAGMLDIPEVLAQQQLRALLTQIFPQLQGVQFTHSWRGYTGFSFDFMPNVGKIDKVWHAMGYSGNGNTMAPYLGNKVALQMLNDSAGETAFNQTHFNNPWWYRGVPWFLPGTDILLRCQDWLDNRG